MLRFRPKTAASALAALLLLGSAGAVHAVPVFIDADSETGGGAPSGLMARLARAVRSDDKSNCVPGAAVAPAAGKAADETKGATERAAHPVKNCPATESAAKSDPNRAPKPMLRLP